MVVVRTALATRMANIRVLVTAANVVDFGVGLMAVESVLVVMMSTILA